MPRSIDPFAYTNWETAPVLRDLLNDVKAHVDDAMRGDRASKRVIDPALEELAESCITCLKELGMQDMDILRVINQVFEGQVVHAPA